MIKTLNTKLLLDLKVEVPENMSNVEAEKAVRIAFYSLIAVFREEETKDWLNGQLQEGKINHIDIGHLGYDIV